MTKISIVLPFRVVKHMGEHMDNKVIKHFDKYNAAVAFNLEKSNQHWIECLCVDGEWYGLV